jgi:hypothetical protein
VFVLLIALVLPPFGQFRPPAEAATSAVGLVMATVLIFGLPI